MRLLERLRVAETHQGSAPEPEPSHFLFFLGNDFSPWGTELISPPPGSSCMLGLFYITKTAHGTRRSSHGFLYNPSSF